MDRIEALKVTVKELSALCSHLSVREDENGPYIFALGLKGVHTLQLRAVSGGGYVAEFWHGASAETERVVGEPSFPTREAAVVAAAAWLHQDAT